MDLNYLYKRHQISLAMAERACSEGARRAHRGLAQGYASQIAAAKNSHSRAGAALMERMSRGEAADELREQAASCRGLARRARTPSGSTALTTVADQFDKDARRIDPWSLKR